MSTTTNVESALVAAAAALRTLPAPDATPGAPAQGSAALSAAIPGPGAKAISAALAGAASGTIILVVSAELAAQIENGPVGPQELALGLEPALVDASAALGDVRHEAAQVLDAEVALANAEGNDAVTVVPIISADGTPVGSLVLLLDQNETVVAAGADSAHFESLSEVLVGGVATRAVELLNDVEMGVTAELGRTRMTVRELLAMQPGSIVELDRAAGSPVDLLVNGTLVARGEVVVIDEEFGVRITEIIGYDAKKTNQ